jgi:FlaA1/EpsC-like NDP-sugar epimerase
MGRPIRLRDLTTRLMEIEAAAGYPRVPIDVIGLRPGEKLHEVMSDRRLVFERTVDRRLQVACDPSALADDVPVALSRIRAAALRHDAAGVLRVLADAVPGFEPSAQAHDAANEIGPVASKARRARRAA